MVITGERLDRPHERWDYGKTCATRGHHLKLGEGRILGSALNCSICNAFNSISYRLDPLITQKCTVPNENQVWYTLGHHYTWLFTQFWVSVPSQGFFLFKYAWLNWHQLTLFDVWQMFDSFHLDSATHLDLPLRGHHPHSHLHGEALQLAKVNSTSKP